VSLRATNGSVAISSPFILSLRGAKPRGNLIRIRKYLLNGIASRKQEQGEALAMTVLLGIASLPQAGVATEGISECNERNAEDVSDRRERTISFLCHAELVSASG